MAEIAERVFVPPVVAKGSVHSLLCGVTTSNPDYLADGQEINPEQMGTHFVRVLNKVCK